MSHNTKQIDNDEAERKLKSTACIWLHDYNLPFTSVLPIQTRNSRDIKIVKYLRIQRGRFRDVFLCL